MSRPAWLRTSRSVSTDSGDFINNTCRHDRATRPGLSSILPSSPETWRTWRTSRRLPWRSSRGSGLQQLPGTRGTSASGLELPPANLRQRRLQQRIPRLSPKTRTLPWSRTSDWADSSYFQFPRNPSSSCISSLRPVPGRSLRSAIILH